MYNFINADFHNKLNLWSKISLLPNNRFSQKS